MHRSWLLVLGLLFISAFGFGQSTSSDSQGMQALVAEVHQLRRDLQTTNGYALKAQILLYRLQVQEATVARVSQNLNDLHSGIAVMQERQRNLMATIKLFEKVVDEAETSPTDRKEAEGEISRVKAELESATAEEQRRQTAKMETEEQLRTEQAKLSATRRPSGTTGKSPGRQSAIIKPKKLVESRRTGVPGLNLSDRDAYVSS